MLHYCPFYDIGLCGDGWRSFVTRYHTNDPFAVPSGCELVLADLEAPHHYNLRITMFGKQKQADAVQAFIEFHDKVRAEIPADAIYAQYAVPATWHWAWASQSETKKQTDIDHWCWITDAIFGDDPNAMLAAQCYDIELDPDPSDGDEHEEYEHAYLSGRFELTAAVAAKTGRKWAAVLLDRAKPIPKSPMGRLLWPHELAAKCQVAKSFGPDAIINWHSGVWWVDVLTAEYTKASDIAAQAAMRVDWNQIGGQLLGPNEFALSNRPHLQRLARVDRLRSANTIIKETT